MGITQVNTLQYFAFVCIVCMLMLRCKLLHSFFCEFEIQILSASFFPIENLHISNRWKTINRLMYLLVIYKSQYSQWHLLAKIKKIEAGDGTLKILQYTTKICLSLNCCTSIYLVFDRLLIYNFILFAIILTYWDFRFNHV